MDRARIEGSRMDRRGRRAAAATSKAEGPGTRGVRGPDFLLVGALLLGAAAGPGFAAELTFAPGPQSGGYGTLAIGDSLLVGARGLPPGAAADLRLRDPSGAAVAELKLRADDRGEVPLDLLWRRTGVVGCDCEERAGLGPETFLTFEDAERALAGTKWTVELGSGAVLLDQETLTLEPTRDFQVYASDAAGCPRGRIAPSEDLYLTFRGPKAPDGARVFLVADRPTWDEPMPLIEVRESIGPSGEVVGGDLLPLATRRIWPGDPRGARGGYFAVVVRTAVEDDSPKLDAGDLVLGYASSLGPKSVEAGVRIRDWGCAAPN